MKKRNFKSTGIGLSILFSATAAQGDCLGAVLEVGQDKPYKTVVEAARASSPGDTILVDPGVYVASLALKDGCTLTGTGRGRTILVANLLRPGGCTLSPGNGTLIRGLWLSGGWQAAVDGFSGWTSHLENCVIWGNGVGLRGIGPGNQIIVANCAIFGNDEGVASFGGASVALLNTIVYGNTASFTGDILNITATYSCIEGEWSGEGNTSADPLLARPEQCNMGELLEWPHAYSPWPDPRVRGDSPCIDAGLNSPDLPEFDIAGMHRIMYGGKSFTVDMGAYEFYINRLEPVIGTDETIFTWSSLADKTYSIFYTDDLFNWQTAIANFPSSGNTTTSWTDDGSLTGIPPLLDPKRFYRVLENP